MLNWNNQFPKEMTLMIPIPLETLRQQLPLYLYQASKIRERCALLQKTLPGFELIYSIKANPYEPIVHALAALGFGADAASAQEVEIAAKCGIHPERIYYSAPGKTQADIQRSLGNCILIADSLLELERIEKAAAQTGMGVKIGLRIHPCMDMDEKTAAASKFGIGEEQVADVIAALKECPHLQVAGLHVHLRSQVRDGRSLGRYYQQVYALAERFAQTTGYPFDFVNFGSGIAILDNEEQTAFALSQIERAAAEVMERNHSSLRSRLIIESGRFLVGPAGTYVTEVVDIKESRGCKYLIVRGGLNGFMRPVLDQLLQGDPENHEPLYSSNFSYPIEILNQESEREKVTVVGNLCSGQDVLARNMVLPKAHVGDLLTVGNAGAYGYTFSPLLFSGFPEPGQIWLDEA